MHSQAFIFALLKSGIMEYRIEKDTMGEIHVPADKYWGAQTQRSLLNFRIGPEGSMPIDVVQAFGYIKKAAAIVNHKFGLLPSYKMKAISLVCDEITEGHLNDQFPLVVWQTGSGTHTNMNCNEVISNRAHVMLGNKLGEGTPAIHPNDDVNMSQSSNDTFPTAMHIAAYRMIDRYTIPSIKILRNTLDFKAESMAGIVKTGRTHLMDATPIRLGQELSGYVSQLSHGLRALENSLPHLSELAIGGTAVGTGLNSPEGFDREVAAIIASLTGLPFVSAENKFEALAANDAIVEAHNALKQVAVSLMKIANDIRLLASGPRTGIGEIIIPANEPGSSIMPGKVNPTQVEGLTMVCAQVIGNDTTISFSGASGQLELNTYKPVMIYAFLQSASLIADACMSFTNNCIAGIEPNNEQINKNISQSLMLVTALSPHIGYENAARIAKKAFSQNKSLREAAIESELVNSVQFDDWVVPEKMTRPEKSDRIGRGQSKS